MTNNNRVKINSESLRDRCVREIYDAFEKWDEKDLRDAYNALNMSDTGWWDRVLYWAGLEPEETTKNKKRYFFRSRTIDEPEVYAKFTGWIVDDAHGGGPSLNFYRKTEPGIYEKFDEIPKYCLEAKLRGLIKEKEEKKPRSW